MLTINLGELLIFYMSRHINSYSPEERRSIVFNRIQEFVNSQGGKCFTTEYFNDETELELECKNGHRWKIRAQSVLRGSWCKECWRRERAGKHLVLKDGLEQARLIASQKGGECLSSEYINNVEPLHWRCGNGHTWKAPLSDVKRRTWCPQCSRGSGVRERLCKHYIEQITGHEFKKCRPQWLISSRGYPMELDGFCQELKIAFEHNGEQHYIESTHFHRRNEKLKYRKIDDQRKRELCYDQGIFLLEIPFSIPVEELGIYIWESLYQNNPDHIVIDSSDLENLRFLPSNELKQLQAIAKEQGGECLSNVWMGTVQKHRFRCAQGHEWEAIASNVIHRHTWCPICKPEKIGNSNRKHSVESMMRLAALKGGQFLSDSFESVNHKYRWQCSQGHEWIAAPADIRRKTWCPQCSRESQKNSILEMREVAKQRGGKCLSDVYVNSQTKLLWECRYGHQWMATPGNIKGRKSWCPFCSGKRPKAQLEEAQPSQSSSVKDQSKGSEISESKSLQQSEVKYQQLELKMELF